MAGNTIGEAFVSIRPDTTGFEAALMASVTSAITQVQAAVKPIDIPVNANIAPLVAEMAVAGKRGR